MTAPRPSLGLAVLLTTLVALGPLSTASGVGLSCSARCFPGASSGASAATACSPAASGWARRLAPYPTMAGSASALMGFCQMSIAALVGIAVGHGLAQGGGALSAAVAICTALAPLSYLVFIRLRGAA